MNHDWTKRIEVDWSGRRGPIIKEEDIKKSVIKRILHNDFSAPFSEKVQSQTKPWWNPFEGEPQDSIGRSCRTGQFVPGLRTIIYPKVSTLKKQQHMQGLRVMSIKYKHVQPKNYPAPTHRDFLAVKEFQELYEAEQKEYLKWAKLKWINGDCLRALRPKPDIERVYEAEFRMKAHRMQSMPQNFVMAAQIPLEKKDDVYELAHTEDLVNVPAVLLPMVDYPDEMESEFSILMKSCPVPEPCKEHPCRFALPHESTLSVLPLTEVNRELALMAVSYDAPVIASESALRCLLDTDRSWKITVSVVQVECPDSDGMTNVVVLGSEFSVQKECSMERTYKAYKHMLWNTLTNCARYLPKSFPEEGISPQKVSISPVAKEPIVPLNSSISLSSDEDSSDENSNEKLHIDDNEKKSEAERLADPREITKEPDRLPTNEYTGQSIDESGSGRNEPETCHSAKTIPEVTYDNYEPDYSIDTGSNYSRNEPFQLTMGDLNKTNLGSSCGLDFYEPDYSIDTRPSYGRDGDDSSDEFDQSMIEAPKTNPESFSAPSIVHPEPNCSGGLNEYKNFDKSNDSYEEYSSEPDRLIIDSPAEPKAGSSRSFYQSNYHAEPSDYSDDYTMNEKPNYSYDDGYELNQLMIDVDKTNLNILESNDVTDLMSETYEDAVKMSETYKKAAEMSETYEDAAEISETYEDAAEISEIDEDVAMSDMCDDTANTSEAYGEADESNENSATMSETNEDDSMSKICDDTAPIFKITKDSNLPSETIDDNDPIFKINADNIPMFETGNKGIEANVTTLMSDIKNSIASMLDTGDDDLMYTKSLENSKTETRLGISGMIIENFSETNKVSEVKELNEAEVPTKPTIRRSARLSQTEVIDTNKLNKSQKRQRVTKVNNVNIHTRNKSIEHIPKPFVRKKINANDVLETFNESTNEACLKTNTRQHRSESITSTVGGSDLTEIDSAILFKNAIPVTSDQCIQKNTELSAVIKPAERIKFVGLKTYSKMPTLIEINSSMDETLDQSDPELGTNSFLNEASNKSDLPSNKRIRKLSEQIEHDYCDEKEPRKRSISEVEHDYCGSSYDEESVINLLFTDCPADTAFEDDNDVTAPENSSFGLESDFGNLPTKYNVAIKKPRMIIRELFGDESDSDDNDDIIRYNPSFTNNLKIIEAPRVQSETQSCNYETTASNLITKKLSFVHPIDSPSNTEKSPLKPCLKKSIDNPPRNSRTLSFNDPLTSDPETLSISEPDSDDAILGFEDGLAVPLKTPQKLTKKQEQTSVCLYSLRSRNNLKKTENFRETVILYSNTDSDTSVYSNCAHNSMASQPKNKSKQNNTDNSSPRRKRLSRRLNTESNARHTKKAQTPVNPQQGSDITNRLRRSRRISDRSKETVQPNIAKTNISKSLSKITKKNPDRRKSLPANIFSKPKKINKAHRSKSLTNLNDIGNANSRVTRSSSSSLNKDSDDCLRLSERTKRYLRRILTSDSSDSEHSDGGIRTHRYNNRSVSSAYSGAEKSGSETQKRIKRYTRSSTTAPNNKTAAAKASKQTNSTPKTNKQSERTERYIRRSMYSSCEEKDQPIQARRKKTKKQPEETIDRSNTTDTSEIESNVENIEHSRLKTEPIDDTERGTEPTNNQMNETEYIKESYVIKIDVTEEINEHSDNETLSVPQVPQQVDLTAENSSHAIENRILTGESLQNATNTNRIKESNNAQTSLFDDDSDSSDFFNMVATGEVNISHFTAAKVTNSDESEEEALFIDDPEADRIIPEITPQAAQSKSQNETSKHQRIALPRKVKGEPQTQQKMEVTSKIKNKDSQSSDLDRRNKEVNTKQLSKEAINDIIGVYNCTCKGTNFENPPPRSYNKWLVRNKSTDEGFQLIIHSSHKARKGANEVLLEPLIEYQPELGGRKQPAGRLRAMALSLMLRNNATLLNVRIDHESGSAIVLDHVTKDEFIHRHGNKKAEIADTLHTTLDQLRSLLPGQYILAHDRDHGHNAMLYSPGRGGEHSLRLLPEDTNMPDAEDALYAKAPPDLDRVLLPFHKYKNILPLAFTPNKSFVRESKKMAAAMAKAKHPPSAIQWPKKKKSKKRANMPRPIDDQPTEE